MRQTLTNAELVHNNINIGTGTNTNLKIQWLKISGKG
jgi:hypothetical protein